MDARLTVLYVDDDPDIRALAEICLQSDEQMAVRVVASGAEALALLDRGRWSPDIILLDVMMPVMDGPCVLAALRRRARVMDTPVIFLTARTLPEEISAFCELGIAGVIAKPFNPAALAPEVRRIAALPRVGQRAGSKVRLGERANF